MSVQVSAQFGDWQKPMQSLAGSGVNSRNTSHMVGESNSLDQRVSLTITGAGRNPSPGMW